MHQPLVEDTILAVVHATRRIAPCGAILGAFNIRYASCNSVKSQFLTDLMTEAQDVY